MTSTVPITNELLFKTFSDEVLSKIFLYRPIHKFAEAIKKEQHEHKMIHCVGCFGSDVPDEYTENYVIIDNYAYGCPFYKYMLIAKYKQFEWNS